MKIVSKPRQQGKTTELIRMSAEHKWTIVSMNKDHVARTVDMARSMDLVIPRPITFQEFLEGNYWYSEGLLIDDAEYLLQSIAFVTVHAIAITEE